MSNVVLGLFSPFRFGLKEYEGYDITKFKDKIRFLEVIINRDGEMGGICPLYFDGAVCQFSELPKPNDPEISKVYEYLKAEHKRGTIMNIIGRLFKVKQNKKE